MIVIGHWSFVIGHLVWVRARRHKYLGFLINLDDAVPLPPWF